MFDYLIVGAGFTGCVLAERITSIFDKKVLLIDKANHIGGHCYDYINEDGILIHKYGPHIFHTNNHKVFSYLSNFTDWIPYFHLVLGVIEGKNVPIPFNINSIQKLFPPQIANKYIDILITKYGYNVKIPILELMETKDENLNFLAQYIYENLFNGYTIKQWGLKPEELEPSVTSRVPIFISKDNRYFQDTYQVIPQKGYTKLFENLVKNKNIKLLLNTDFKEIESLGIHFNQLIYTAPIDEFYGFEFGELPYRSLNFSLVRKNVEYFQKVAQINYPNNYEFTRITEFKYFSKSKLPYTYIAFEYPNAYIINENEPYYPIPTKSNKTLFNQYRQKADLENNIYFEGRLAQYKYINMDQCVLNALQLFETLKK